MLTVASHWRFLLNRRLLCGPDRCLMSSCKLSNAISQKQQLNRPSPPSLITFRCTEHRCFSKCAFCLNMATHNRHANGFSPVCTRRCVLRFQLIPNCLPQYSQRYSRTGGAFPGVNGAAEPPSPPSVSPPPGFTWAWQTDQGPHPAAISLAPYSAEPDKLPSPLDGRNLTSSCPCCCEAAVRSPGPGEGVGRSRYCGADEAGKGRDRWLWGPRLRCDAGMSSM